jgi:outer membrane receptor protein involved in Fe transport
MLILINLQGLTFKAILSLLIFLQFTIGAFGQEKAYFGKIIDKESNEDIPYATVLLVSNSSNRVITGTTTDDKGEFEFKSDSVNLYVKVIFIGYDELIIKEFTPNVTLIDLGQLALVSSIQNVGEVQVTAEKSSMVFKLDKRVFIVGKDISSTGVNAIEVLNSVPSVNVDIEGNIQLRGNSGVQILINGKPSVLSDDPSKALGTITADMIESIEVITNPSAKYDASGTSGILNIILKKEENKGFNGSISVNTGWPHNHSVGGSINYRAKKFNLFTQFGAGYRSLPSYDKSENRNYKDTTTVIGEGVAYRDENFYNITLGTDYYIDSFNTITLSGNFAYEIEDQPSVNDLYIYNSQNDLVSQYRRTEETSALNPKYQYDFQYNRQFKNNKEHTLQFNTLGRFFGKDQSSIFQNSYSLGTEVFGNQKTETSFFQFNQTYQLDYVNPIGKKWTIEAGVMYDINDVGNDYAVFNEVGNTYVVDSNFTNDFQYNQKVLGVYSTGAYELNKWGLKLGLRVENTDLTTLLTNTNEGNNRNFTNLFPTVHTSYKFSKKVQVQAGYSRRIFRPHLWDLNPFFNIRNNYSIRTGNPNLLPEFADSYELTGIFYIKKLTLNVSAYYLYSTEVKENISYSENNIVITRPENIGVNHKIGGELNWKYSLKKWFSTNGDFNYGYFNRIGSFESQNFDFQGNQWSTKMTTKFKLKYDIDFEITGNYQSSYKTIQGNVSGFAFADAGLRKKIWKGKAVVNLVVRDIFASRIRESIVDQSSFYAYYFSQRGRFIILGFSYSFGNGEAMSYSGGGRR